MAERLARHLSERLGDDAVAAHHGSLSKESRLDAETRLKRGDLRVLVATASLELGIDIGSVDLVCQIGSPHRIATLIQRVGRSGHTIAGLPKGRVFPETRDDLVECAALIRAVRRGELDAIVAHDAPLDVLAQQLVAECAADDAAAIGEAELFELSRRAWPYRDLRREDFDAVVAMTADGFSTRRGRRSALLHRDEVHATVRGRRGARLLAMVSGGAIPDVADYRVVLEPDETFVGTLNEDFAIESNAGDIFQLGNASWRILQVSTGVVRVADARGAPPSIPFWLGEAPARSDELSRAVSDLRALTARPPGRPRHAVRRRRRPLAHGRDRAPGQTPRCRLLAYLDAGRRALDVMPTQDTLVLERFFDESGGMQLVLHAPFGSRINKAWCLALRKRFCRQFNFELQAAATEDALLLSLGPQHSFPLADVFRYLHPETVKDVLVQAFLDAPVFKTRWRWNATISLAVPRARGSRRVAPQLQRMLADDLMAAVFPDAAACLENIPGDRRLPDHPLVNQTVRDCLHEAMDFDGLLAVLRRIHRGELQLLARDTPEPSVFAYDILNAKPYAFLDDAPLEERRTHAVQTRRARDSQSVDDSSGARQGGSRKGAGRGASRPTRRRRAARRADDLRRADGATSSPDSIPRGCARSWRRAARPSWSCRRRPSARRVRPSSWPRVFRPARSRVHWRLPSSGCPSGTPFIRRRSIPRWRFPRRERRSRGRRPRLPSSSCGAGCTIAGPVTADALAGTIGVSSADLDEALLALEAEGVVLRGRFTPGAAAGTVEWCDRALLARIHRYTLNRLRAEIEPVTPADFMRFLFTWQHVDDRARLTGPDGLRQILERLDGFEAPAAAWERALLPSRLDRVRAVDARRALSLRRGGVGAALHAGHAQDRLGDTDRPAHRRSRRCVAAAAGGRGAR